MSEFVLTPLKYIVVDRISNGVGLPAEHENPDWPRYIRTTDIAGPRALRDDVWYSQPPALLKQAGVEPGDLLLTNAGTVGKAYLHTSDESAVFAGYLTRVRPNPLKADSRYVAYCCESQPYWDQINTGATRSTIDNYSSGKYQDLQIPIPPLDTQRRIADMLDTETARIDTLIEKNERVLNLLHLRRGSVCDAMLGADVSKGRSLYLCLLQQPTYGILKPEQVDDGVPCLRVKDIDAHGNVAWDDAVRVPLQQSAESARTRIRPGDVLVSVVGTIGRSAVISEVPTAEANVSRALARLVVDPTVLLPDWLHAWFGSSDFGQQFEARVVGTAQKVLNMEDLSSYTIPAPPITLQRDRLNELGHATGQIDSLRTKVEHQQELLRTRRQALITAAVTGTIRT